MWSFPTIEQYICLLISAASNLLYFTKEKCKFPKPACLSCIERVLYWARLDNYHPGHMKRRRKPKLSRKLGIRFSISIVWKIARKDKIQTFVKQCTLEYLVNLEQMGEFYIGCNVRGVSKTSTKFVHSCVRSKSLKFPKTPQNP